MELSFIEADRELVYLGFFLAAFLIAQTDQRRQRFAEGLAIAVTLVALLGLASRLLPHVLEVSDSLGSGPRMRYPLGYWNANGAMFGIAVALLLWTSRRAAWTALRWASVAAMPAVLLALYFTYSRGGLLSLLIAAGVTIALSRDRLWMLATLGIGAARRRCRRCSRCRRGPASPTTSPLRRPSIRGGGGADPARRHRPRPGAVRGAALGRAPRGGADRAGGGAVAQPGRAEGGGRRSRRWSRSGSRSRSAAAPGDQFNRSDAQFPARPEQHFSQLSGAGRHDFFRVAFDAFEEKPLLGIGAGTYRFAWDRHRTIKQPVLDAHSLYLESFAELGVVGGLIVLALVGGLLWTAFAAWRAAPHPQRERYAVLFAAMLAFAVGAGIDWFWEIAAFGAVFVLAAGVTVAARCAQLAPAGVPGGSGRRGERRFGLTVAGLAIAWIAAIALIGPLLVERELDASRNAAGGGDFGSAVDHADTARSIEPFAASPYVQLGLLAELQRDYPTAKERLSQAISRQDLRLAALLPALQGRARGRRRIRRPGRPQAGQAAEPARRMPALGMELRVSDEMARNAQETAPRKAQPPSRPGAAAAGGPHRCRGAPRPDRRRGSEAPRLAAAPLAGHRRLADPGRDSLRRHRGEPEDRHRHPLLGGDVQPGRGSWC